MEQIIHWILTVQGSDPGLVEKVQILVKGDPIVALFFLIILLLLFTGMFGFFLEILFLVGGAIFFVIAMTSMAIWEGMKYIWDARPAMKRGAQVTGKGLKKTSKWMESLTKAPKKGEK